MKERKDGRDVYRMLVDGQWVPAAKGELAEVENPTTEEILGGEDGKYRLDSYLRKKTLYVNYA